MEEDLIPDKFLWFYLGLLFGLALMAWMDRGRRERNRAKLEELAKEL